MVSAYEPTARTLAMRVAGESGRSCWNTSRSGSERMFSWPPRQEAHGQPARSRLNGYTLTCPSFQLTVNSRDFLLTVMLTGFSFMTQDLEDRGAMRGLHLLPMAAYGAGTTVRKSDAAQPARVLSYGATTYHQGYPSTCCGPSLTWNVSDSSPRKTVLEDSPGAERIRKPAPSVPAIWT